MCIRDRDNSRSSLSREYLRKVDSSPEVKIVSYCADMEEAKLMLKDRLAYGIIYIPAELSLIHILGNADIASPLNGLGNSLVDAFRTDTRNMYAGALTLTQPLYMGGKIRAYNKITKYAEELARQQQSSYPHRFPVSAII